MSWFVRSRLHWKLRICHKHCQVNVIDKNNCPDNPLIMKIRCVFWRPLKNVGGIESESSEPYCLLLLYLCMWLFLIYWIARLVCFFSWHRSWSINSKREKWNSTSTTSSVVMAGRNPPELSVIPEPQIKFSNENFRRTPEFFTLYSIVEIFFGKKFLKWEMGIPVTETTVLRTVINKHHYRKQQQQNCASRGRPTIKILILEFSSNSKTFAQFKSYKNTFWKKFLETRFLLGFRARGFKL